MWVLNLISTIGLLFDIIGVLLLFKFGLPSKIIDSNQILSIQIRTKDEQEAEEKRVNRHNKKVTFWAYCGLSLILLGFIFQLIGTNYRP